MTTGKELMQQALDALEKHVLEYETVEALRARLAQPEPEPVAWWHDMGDVVDLNVSGRGTPLYTAPPQREWQGLTDEEVTGVWDSIIKYAPSEVRLNDFARAIEAKLKEKNNG